jgi:hypothetical protein
VFKQKELKMYCFSPPVMLATFAIEIIAAIYVYTKYKSSQLQRLVIATLTLLAVFQLAEYNVCGQLGISSAHWSKLGYVAITMLPPLGLHIVHQAAKKKAGRAVAGAYASGALFSTLFVFGSVFENYACGGNYVIFQLKSPIGGLFFIYYYLWLFTAIFFAMQFVKQPRLSKKRKSALVNLVIGYALFMIPTSLSMLVFPATAAALPSVMCGFAVLFALVLTFRVVPELASEKLKHKI